MHAPLRSDAGTSRPHRPRGSRGGAAKRAAKRAAAERAGAQQLRWTAPPPPKQVGGQWNQRHQGPQYWQQLQQQQHHHHHNYQTRLRQRQQFQHCRQQQQHAGARNGGGDLIRHHRNEKAQTFSSGGYQNSGSGPINSNNRSGFARGGGGEVGAQFQRSNFQSNMNDGTRRTEGANRASVIEPHGSEDKENETNISSNLVSLSVAEIALKTPKVKLDRRPFKDSGDGSGQINLARRERGDTASAVKKRIRVQQQSLEGGSFFSTSPRTFLRGGAPAKKQRI